MMMDNVKCIKCDRSTEILKLQLDEMKKTVDQWKYSYLKLKSEYHRHRTIETIRIGQQFAEITRVLQAVKRRNGLNQLTEETMDNSESEQLIN